MAEQRLSVDTQTVVLVEGESDRMAVEALAQRRGRDLAAEGVAVVSMGGATNVGHFLERYGPPGSNLRLAGLCDVGEEGYFRRGLERVRLGSDLSRDDMEGHGFYVCDADLEDELIRALGTKTVEQFIDEQGELGSFRTFQKQPAQRGRAAEQHLRRFIGVRSGRKLRYAPALVNELDLDHVPRPLDGLLAHL